VRLGGPSIAIVEAIEAKAQRMLEKVPPWLWDGETLPVPVEHVADSCHGLLVRDVEDLGGAPGVPEMAHGQHLSGLLLPDRGEIWVNAAEGRDWPGRRRFTIGHELGHWCLHRDDGEPVFCRAAVVDPQEPPADERPPRPVPEEEADVFAAALLMPAELMRREYAADRDFGRMCERFSVSAKAMSRRMRQVIPSKDHAA
jgi:uncharacterized protein DUF955